MSTEKTGVAGQEKSGARTRVAKRTAGTVINIDTVGNNDVGRSQPEAEQHADPAPTTQASEPETPALPIFEQYMPFRTPYDHRETVHASPLAATLFARFDANYPGVQPAEFAVFIDPRLRDRGHI